MSAVFASAGLIAEVKQWIRIKADSLDEEVEQLVEACRLDLFNSGVKKVDSADPLIKQAVKLYCKANFGYDNSSEKFAKSYEALKTSLSLSGEYNKEDS